MNTAADDIALLLTEIYVPQSHVVASILSEADGALEFEPANERKPAPE